MNGRVSIYSDLVPEDVLWLNYVPDDVLVAWDDVLGSG